MPLVIKTTGLEDYVSGDGRIKMLIIGGAGVGKTRMSSFWPRPIYADTEGGRGSIADRNVPYAEIKTSQDMLDFLAYLKAFEQQPRDKRPYDTVVIDTLDGFQRKVMDERLQQTKKQSFSGWDDWGYLDSKMQMLLVRLLNLDLNVLVLCHYKDKTIGVGDDARTEVALQLKGDIGNSVVNDFDLIGRLGTYWAAEGGERVEKRGLTFKKTPDWPQLKDRFGVMQDWTQISLTSEQDYEFIRDAFRSRIDSLSAAQVIGEIPTSGPEISAGVVAPDAGPLPPVDPKDMPLSQFDKATLAKIARDEGVSTTVDGQPIKGNTIKSELVQAIEAARAAKAAKPAESDAGSASPAPAEPDQVTADEVVAPTPAEVVAAIPEQRTAEPEPTAEPTSVEAASEQVEAPATAAPEPVETVSAPVDTATGEIAPEAPAGSVVEAQVVEVPSEQVPAETPSVPAQPAPEGCQSCGKSLEGENGDYLKLAYIKFRTKLCNACYLAKKASA